MGEPESDSAQVYWPLENPLARPAREARYRFAVNCAQAGRILEAGCGARDGALLLAERGATVMAVDISKDAVKVAAETYHSPLVRYGVMDCQSLALRERSFDVVVSFEVLEHVPDSEAYVREMARVLRPGGLYIGSTPNRARPDFRPNPDHVQEFLASELVEFLLRHFARVELYGEWASRLVEGRGFSFRRALTQRDRLGLRRLIPQAIKDRINRALFRLKSAHLVDAGDYEFRRDETENAPVLVYVCRK